MWANPEPDTVFIPGYSQGAIVKTYAGRVNRQLGVYPSEAQSGVPMVLYKEPVGFSRLLLYLMGQLAKTGAKVLIDVRSHS